MALTWLSSKAGQPPWNPQGVDGKYGPLTQAAVKAFQGASSLAQDGECGAQTAGALDAAMGLAPAPAPLPAPVIPAPVVPPSPPTVAPPASVSPYPGTGAWQTNGAYIKRYQSALTYLSTTLGQPSWNPGGVDGKYGPNTQAAVKAFQGAQSLPVDGQCGPTTAAALDHLLSAGG
jgi:peptidoglycan hydrolase-like protein with peptidoglycan-binding domain